MGYKRAGGQRAYAPRRQVAETRARTDVALVYGEEYRLFDKMGIPEMVALNRRLGYSKGTKTDPLTYFRKRFAYHYRRGDK